MTKPKIYFRADGNSKIGLGHVSRCLALHSMLKEIFDGFFMIKDPSSNVIDLIISEDCEIVEIKANSINDELRFLFNKIITSSSIVVVDGYTFDESYYNSIKTNGHKLVIIDDFCKLKFNADLIINHAEGVTPKDYDGIKSHFLLGIKYALLKKEFRIASQFTNQADNNNLFLCFGGADPNNIITGILNQIRVLQRKVS